MGTKSTDALESLAWPLLAVMVVVTVVILLAYGDVAINDHGVRISLACRPSGSPLQANPLRAAGSYETESVIKVVRKYIASP